jgi:acetamidase/formamidase
VDLTAIEVAFERVRLRLTVRADLVLDRPVADTADDLVVLGFGDTLDDAAADAVSGAIDVLTDNYDVPPSRAYTLCSIAGDLVVTQAVNGVCGVHVKIPHRVLGAGVRLTTAEEGAAT